MDPETPTATAATMDTPPEDGRRWWYVFIGTWLTLALVVVVQFSLSATSLHAPFYWPGFLRVRVVGALVSLALSLPLLWIVRRLAPPAETGAIRSLVLALAAVIPASVLAEPLALWIDQSVVGTHTTFVGSYLAMALMQFVFFAIAVVAANSVELQNDVNRRRAYALQLEASLSEARLQALSSQLQPHFLFNTLTAISVLIHRDAEAAGVMLARLSELLRATLRQPAAHVIPLREELTLIGHYSDIMRVRYGPRLTIHIDAKTDTHGILVPSFVLQPLVENALEHGIARRAGAGTVTVSAEQSGGKLRLVVVDDGPGLGGSGEVEGGIGLSNTRDRLRQLYGDGASLTLEGSPGGGARAVIVLPERVT